MTLEEKRAIEFFGLIYTKSDETRTGCFLMAEIKKLNSEYGAIRNRLKN